MRALQRLHCKLGVVGVVDFAVEREWLLLAIRGMKIMDEFKRRRLPQIVVEAERLKIVGVDARHQSDLHAPTKHLIDDRDLLGQAQGMIERHNVAHRTDAHAARVHRGADGIEARGRHPALVRPEMVFDAEAVVEANVVAHLKFAPQLLIALMRGHPRLTPDMRKMREFHCANPAVAAAKSRGSSLRPLESSVTKATAHRAIPNAPLTVQR